ncbi:dihydropteroate synthase [Seinonella peptonophila]|uniref:dihydropteroate synthase n=1 Tax=Seinonella peptonophila TaxID=112248 RepID=UPI003BF5C649
MQRVIKTGKYQLPIGERTLVMGILNVTPDSFSDGGKYLAPEAAVAHAMQMVKEGADIIDIGGESTRPGHQSVSLDEELARVIPIVQAVADTIQVPISIDTYKASVAKEAIEAGASIINDVWGGKYDPEMRKVAAKLDVPMIFMHNRSNTVYSSMMKEIKQELLESVNTYLQAGGREEHVILDPGIGFAKGYHGDLHVMKHLEQIVALGYPVLLGTSRKSMIGKTLDLPPEQRLEGTAATVALGIAKGCHIVRVHDVKEMVRVCRMMDAMLNNDWGETLDS